ncbi:transposase [Nannocystis pusilla]|uniref:Transposase n=1 Tax=Nannocystis pusilla TaxID=889268 RepID=A0ABS7TKS0_9BACT|nr:transposase [Nannocystis pusilla]MBZ5708817.1 transposase [Nannocystis pusilla]
MSKAFRPWEIDQLQLLPPSVEAEGIEEPTREDLARLDRKRPKKGSNEEWVHPHDPEAQIMKMKDGSTHLAHKHEQAVDLETGAIVGVTVHGGAAGDAKTLEKTLEVADANLAEVRQEGSEKAKEQLAERVEEVVADKGYHSNDVLTNLEEVERGHRRWEGKQAERDAVRRNRRRMKRSFDQLFLKSILGHPAVHCPLPATSSAKHMADNVRAGFGRLPDAAEREKIAALVAE